ncbi:MAG: murein hydrolase activator EnvC family protein [Thermodesulfovibrio sp.]|jgi:septal ring factor EnvC (AmiA/AmiB activator)|uniref:Peptidoglycan DD-metalloendopeptidase family protein n=1 Tax=Thermodesulfovibrio obliviosus TaxID=3118332 RepID=A0AAU8H2I8_9BACT
MSKKLHIIIALFFIVVSSVSFAAQPKEELNQIKKELKIHKKKLEETKKIEENVLEDLKRVSRQLSEIEKNIKNHRAKIKSLQIRIAETEKGIKTYSAQLEERKIYLINRIKGIQKLSKEPDVALIILMEEDTTKAFRLMRNTQKIVNIDKKLIQQYKAELGNLILQQTELKKLYASLKQEEEALKKTEEAQKQKKKEKEVLLAKVRQNKALYEKKIRELEENARRLTRLLQETERKEKRTGKIESLPQGGFTKKRGSLLWPVSGPVVAHYGSQRDPVFNVPIMRSGIYIQAQPGTQVKASADGRVVYANYFKGYENLVIISHGDGYYTVYGNLGSMSVKEGSYVKAGQVIGAVGSNSNIDTPALYFEVRYRGKPLNPEQWLRK